MTGAPSGDTSLVHDGPAANAMRPGRENGTAMVGDEVGSGGPKSRVRQLLRFVHLALAIATVIVCAGIALPGRASASFVAATFVTASETESAARGLPASEPLRHWQACEDGPAVDFKAVESDCEDDGQQDRHCDVPESLALSFGYVPGPSGPDAAWRGELGIDPSRFAAGSGLPRGPPA